MNSTNNRNHSRPAILRWLIGIVVAALCVIALVLASGATDAMRAKAQPTPCPDPIACHALKRMPTQNVSPAKMP